MHVPVSLAQPHNWVLQTQIAFCVCMWCEYMGASVWAPAVVMREHVMYIILVKQCPAGVLIASVYKHRTVAAYAAE